MYEPSTIESGHVSAGDILGRTAGWGESPGSGWDGPHLHFVVSNRSDGGYNTSRPDYDPNPRIDAALAAETPLAPNERRSTDSPAGGNPQPFIHQEVSMYIKIKGKAGARRGGTYVVFADGDGKYSAVFIGTGGPADLVAVTDDRQITALQERISGLA